VVGIADQHVGKTVSQATDHAEVRVFVARGIAEDAVHQTNTAIDLLEDINGLRNLPEL
jgi:hypothetical protein